MPENSSSAKDFNIKEYQLFIESKIERLFYKKNSLTKNDIVNYCSQFTKSASEFFTNKNQSTTSEKLRKAFGSTIKNKPTAVAINTYILYEYGYICCNTCKIVLPLASFYIDKNSWHGYKHYCIECQKSLRNNEDSAAYIRKNRAKYNAYLANYRAKKLNATPKWLSKDQHEEMRLFYIKAKNLNMEVDHIIPINGSNVCGLHVPWNLQLLTRQENASKSNKVLEAYSGELLKCKQL